MKPLKKAVGKKEKEDALWQGEDEKKAVGKKEGRWHDDDEEAC